MLNLSDPQGYNCRNKEWVRVWKKRECICYKIFSGSYGIFGRAIMFRWASNIFVRHEEKYIRVHHKSNECCRAKKVVHWCKANSRKVYCKVAIPKYLVLSLIQPSKGKKCFMLRWTCELEHNCCLATPEPFVWVLWWWYEDGDVCFVQTNTLSWTFLMLIHNSPQVRMSLHFGHITTNSSQPVVNLKAWIMYA